MGDREKTYPDFNFPSHLRASIWTGERLWPSMKPTGFPFHCIGYNKKRLLVPTTNSSGEPGWEKRPGKQVQFPAARQNAKNTRSKKKSEEKGKTEPTGGERKNPRTPGKKLASVFP